TLQPVEFSSELTRISLKKHQRDGSTPALPNFEVLKVRSSLIKYLVLKFNITYRIKFNSISAKPFHNLKRKLQQFNSSKQPKFSPRIEDLVIQRRLTSSRASDQRFYQ
ncbi:hypothetical protein Csa_010817, partial [Cucumis sativus]